MSWVDKTHSLLSAVRPGAASLPSTAPAAPTNSNSFLSSLLTPRTAQPFVPLPSSPSPVVISKNNKKNKKAATKKQKKKKKDEIRSASSDNEGDLSFVDHRVDSSVEEENPFVKRAHYSKSRERAREQEKEMKRKSRYIDDMADDDDEEGEEDEDEDEDADVDIDEDKQEIPTEVYKTLKYTADAFVDISDEEFRQKNARRIARGESPLKRSSSPPDSDEGELFDPSSDSLSQSSSSSSGASLESDESADAGGGDPMDVDEKSVDDVDELVKSAAHIIRATDHRHPPPKKKRETTRSRQAHEAALALKKAVSVDSEADTVDPNAATDHSSDDDDDDDDSVRPGSAIMNVHACVMKAITDLNLKAPDGEVVTSPLQLNTAAQLFEATKTLTAILFNASVEQQKSKTIQAEMNKGHTNIPGQSTSVKQSESAQDALFILNEFTRKEKILALLAHAAEQH